MIVRYPNGATTYFSNEESFQREIDRIVDNGHYIENISFSGLDFDTEFSDEVTMVGSNKKWTRENRNVSF